MHESRTSTKHILIVRNQQGEISNLRGGGARIQSEFFHAKPFIRSLPGKRNFFNFHEGGEREEGYQRFLSRVSRETSDVVEYRSSLKSFFLWFHD